MRADARRNYERIVAAARAEFAERGTDAAYDDIARRAGVGAGTLYRHFPRRIDLVQAVYSSDLDTVTAAADAAVSAPDAFEGLRNFLQAFVRYAESKRVLLNEMHEAFERNPDLKVRMREQLLAATDRVFDRARREGVVRADVTSDDLMHLVGGMCLSAVAPAGSNERLLGVILDGLRAR